jgi:ABC-type transport system involved in multi-copper enzyme maturation permease subunit
MLVRIAVVMFNTYREAVRAKVLHGLFGLALVTAGYCAAVGQYSLGAAGRVVSDLGAAAVALYGALVAIVLSATALHREIELKTLFPILARPIARWEYLVGRYLGTLLTLAVFVVANAAAFLAVLSATHLETPNWQPIAAILGSVGAAALWAWRLPRLRTLSPAVAAGVLLVVAWALCAHSPDHRRVIFVSGGLTLLEVAIVAAVAVFFSSFSSPFLTALFTLGLFIVGRSADTLANLPPKMFGEAVHDIAAALARVVPNLMLYAPSRALLTGEATAQGPLGYAPMAAVQALGWVVALVAASSVIFKRRDLT